MEIKYKSVFKSEFEDFLSYEKSTIKKAHSREINDLDAYFIECRKKEKNVTESEYYNYIYYYQNSNINQKRRYRIIVKFCKFLARFNYNDIFYEEISLDDILDYQPHIYSEEEAEKILKVIDKKVENKEIHSCCSIIFRLYISSGLRPSEPLNLTLKNICISKKYLDIYMSKEDITRRIFLSESMLISLKKYLKLIEVNDNEKIFPIKYETVLSIFKEAVKINNINVDKIKLHDLRHSFSVRALDKMIYELKIPDEEAIVYLQYYMGHSNIYSTQYYLHFTEKMKNEIRKATCISIYKDIKEVKING